MESRSFPLDRVLARYTLYQLPGWLTGAVLLASFVHWDWVTTPVAFALFGALLVKDAILYPLTRSAYEGTSHSAGQALVGRSGVTQQAIDREGYVRVGAELWRARLAPGSEPLAPGVRVHIEAVDRFTLIVASDPETQTEAEGIG